MQLSESITAADICENCEYAHRLYTRHCGTEAVEDYIYCEIDDRVKHVDECTCIEEEK